MSYERRKVMGVLEMGSESPDGNILDGQSSIASLRWHKKFFNGRQGFFKFWS